MNKGFTLIEIMIVVAIAMVLSTVGVMAVGRRMENNAITRVRTELPTYILGVLDRAFTEGGRYQIVLNADGEMTLSRVNVNNDNTTTTTNIETVEFPDSLVYTLTPVSLANSVTIGERGEFQLVGEFIITVKTRSDRSVMTITGSNIAGVNLGRIVVVNN